MLGVSVAAARWWFSHPRVMFHMAPDEPAQLAMARWLSGGVRWNMFDHNTWRPGMALLMAPLFWFTDDTGTIMHGGYLIGAALGGLAAVLLARLATRLTSLSPAACVLAAGAIAIAPPSLSATAFVWAEAVVTVTFLATLTLLLKFYDEPRPGTGLATVAIAALGFVGHSRLLPMLGVVAVLLVVRCIMARAWWVGAAVVGGLVISTYAAFQFADAVFDAVWDNPSSSNTVDTVVERLPHVTEILSSALGQGWYQIVATAGLAAFGAGVLLVRALRRRNRGFPNTVIRDARLVLLVTAPLVVVSMVFMSNRTRTDHRIYGRYNDAILWPVLIVGIAWLLQLRYTRHPRAAVAAIVGVVAGIAAASVGIEHVAGEAMADSVGVRPMVAGLMPAIGSRPNIDVVRVAVVSIVLLAVLLVAALASKRGIAVVIVAVPLLAIAGIRTRDALSLRLNSWEPATAVVAIDEVIPPDAPIGVRFVREADKPNVTWDDQRRRAQLYQFALPGHRFERDRGLDDGVGPYVFAPSNDKILREAGGEILWTDPKVRLALWREPTSPPEDGDS
jgi:hypothetical protein